MNLSGHYIFYLKVSCCIILSLRKGEVTVSLLQFAQSISHADLCKFLPQNLASDWLELYALAEDSELNSEFT